MSHAGLGAQPPVKSPNSAVANDGCETGTLVGTLGGHWEASGSTTP